MWRPDGIDAFEAPVQVFTEISCAGGCSDPRFGFSADTALFLSTMLLECAPPFCLTDRHKIARGIADQFATHDRDSFARLNRTDT
jgi:hypothetical protein